MEQNNFGPDERKNMKIALDEFPELLTPEQKAQFEEEIGIDYSQNTETNSESNLGYQKVLGINSSSTKGEVNKDISNNPFSGMGNAASSNIFMLMVIVALYMVAFTFGAYLIFR